MGEVNLNHVSQKVQEAVKKILNSDGIRGISNDSEHTQLAGLLAVTKSKKDSEFIQGFMLEWEDRKKANTPKEDLATNNKFGQVKEESCKEM